MQGSDAPVRIPLFKPSIRDEAAEAVAEVLRSGWTSLGPKTDLFEKAFSEYLNVPYCVGTNSCTAALHLGLRLLDLEPGQEVITTPMTFVSTNHVILYERLKPVFADIEPETGNLDLKSVRERISEKTGAIIMVHYGGYPCDLDGFYEISQEMKIPVIEDCSHACGASYMGRKIGSKGEIQAFSFQATKNLPMGDGGALTIQSEVADRRLRMLRRFGIQQESYQQIRYKSHRWLYEVPEIGYKYHMNDIEAAIGLVQIEYLDEDNRTRARIADDYRQGLSGIPGLKFLHRVQERQSSDHLFCILAEQRDNLADKLRSAGIEVNVHYRRNDLHPMYEETDLPHAEYFWRHVLSLPMHVLLNDDDISFICDVIRKGW